jgi:penicillin amidase
METIQTTHATRHFTATRNELGVPQVEAKSWREALYALGYLHAIDRPTQMLFGRTLASGRAAEQISYKPELAETDRFFRRAGLHLKLDREASALDDNTFQQLTYYCEGVNDGMHQVGRSLPMWATGFRPEPWNQQAVLLIGNLLSFGGLAVGQQQNERIVVELIQLGLDEARLKELFAPRLDDADFNLLRRVKMASQLSDDALELIADLPRLAGSNAWAVSPERSATGHALLASDPHLEVNRLPAVWYEVNLRWEDHYVLGATLPGCPLFAVGRTERLAWGVTYMKGDTSDYFIEDCRPGGSTGWQYRRGDTWQDFTRRDETIVHKGNGVETLSIYENAQGTLEGDPETLGEGLHLSVLWTGSQPGGGHSMGIWLDVIGCEDTQQAMETVRECPHPTLIWMFADTAGHIGKQGCGRFPKRRAGHSGLLPVPAWDERNHWQGTLPSYLLPHEYDPPCGFLSAANEDINPPGGPQFITLALPDYRQRRIVSRLSELPAATLADMRQLQYDLVSTQARDLLAVFLPLMEEGPFKDRLAAWDCAYNVESHEATLFKNLYINVLLEVFGQEQDIGWRRMLYICSRAGYATMVLTGADKLLHREHSLWWEHRDKGEIVRKAAKRAERAPDVPWSVTNSYYFLNRYFEGRAGGHFLGFHSSRMAMPGCHATVFQGHLLKTATRTTSFAPSYHFVTDLGTDEAWTNLPGGPSESRFSKWYKTDIPNWIRGTYKRLSGRKLAE